MDLHELNIRLQEHMSDGLVTVVGSGLSARHGLPTMSRLADHLLSDVPCSVDASTRLDWQTVKDRLLCGGNLETALDNLSHDSPLIQYVVDSVARVLLEDEAKALADIVAGRFPMPFAQLVPHLLHTTDSAQVITTNYDRLIEAAVEMAGFGLDSSFPSTYVSPLDEVATRHHFQYWVPNGRQLKKEIKPHVRLWKPHGSLDWYEYAGKPVRSAFNMPAKRLMIAPGSSKYFRGYEVPFDLHRERANEAIDCAARFLIIGYGFNDPHLETHLRTRLASTIPCVVLSKQLTAQALACIRQYPKIIGLEEDVGTRGTHVVTRDSEDVFPATSIWDLGNFVKEVLT